MRKTDDFFEIGSGSIIDRGADRSGHDYIVYCSGNGSVRVNTYFTNKNDNYSCCVFYDRKLCDNIEDYNDLSAEYIESQAYGSYMDGAR